MSCYQVDHSAATQLVQAQRSLQELRTQVAAAEAAATAALGVKPSSAAPPKTSPSRAKEPHAFVSLVEQMAAKLKVIVDACSRSTSC